LDIATLCGLIAGFFAVHDVGEWISAPYWLDETWVALSTRVPVSDLPRITSSTPIGWTVLLRAVPDPDALRLIPLAFALFAIVAAYALGRILPWRSRVEAVVAGGLAAGAVVLLPAAQLRHDLKQYTADAALALTILALTEWTERTGTRRRLALLAVAGPVAFLFSSVAVVVTMAAFGGLVLAAAMRREWRELVARAVAGVASGLAMTGWYLAIVEPNRVPALVEFWQGYFPSVNDLPSFVLGELTNLAATSGFAWWWVWLTIVAGGIATIAMKRRTATTIAIVILPAMALVLGVLKMYPLLADRTSYYLVTVWAALAGLAFAPVGAKIARSASRRRPALEPVLVVALALGAVIAFGVANRSWYRLDSPTATSDVRSQVYWVDTHRKPDDVVIISRGARYGYLFYHDDQPVHWTVSSDFAHGWDAILPAESNVVELDGVVLETVRAAVEQAVAMAQRNGPDARVFVIRDAWWNYGEPDAWAAVLAEYQVTYINVGPEPVAVIQPPPPEVT
jgi:hypothetical protein